MSRLAYDAVCDQRDAYRADRDRLSEKLYDVLAMKMRVERATAGLPETPRDPHRPDPMPGTLRAKCMKFQSVIAQQNMLALCERRHGEGKPWADVEAEFDKGLEQARDDDE